MENNIKKKLDKAPITEVVIGLAIEGIFNTPESIDTFYEQSTLKEHFMNKEVIKAVTFEISEKPKISKDVSSGFAFTNADKTETINIELNKIMYSDKSKYVSYEIFIEKFGGILDSIIKFAKSPVKINEIGLRYVNNFDLNPFKLGKDFLINPTVNVKKDDCVDYAIMNNYLSMAGIQSVDNPNMFATVKTLYKVITPMKLNITFDIDTHDKISYTVDNSQDLQSKFIPLKEFKNLIFFSNFENAYEMEEFK